MPPELLRKLENARTGAALRGERRRVTILFCDVEGSTSAAEQLDPEDWTEIMNGLFEHLITPVFRYEGTVGRLTGDGLVAFFGAPIAHEDDPERAVLAALEILERAEPYSLEVERRWGLRPSLRLGINTGLVVVGQVGSDLHLEYTALGDAMNVAARMEQTAASGTIQISEDTHRLVKGKFELEDLGEVEVKGKSRPVHTYRVLAPAAEPASSRGIEGLHSPLVGRDEELATLERILAELGRGRGQLCAVMGEAGMGKSRLVAEVRDRLPKIAPDVRWMEGRSLSYQRSTPYAPIRSLLAPSFGLERDDTDEVANEKIRSTVAEVLGESSDVAPYLAMLFDLDLSGDDLDLVRFVEPPVLRRRVFDAVATYLAALAAQRPLAVVLEDLHWADATSVELLEELMDLTESSMLLLLAVFRPRRADASWRFHERAAREFEHRYTAIDLGPLDRDDSHALVSNLLALDELDERVRALIHERSEGNPFYVEELIRSLLDAGVIVRDGDEFHATTDVSEIPVPDTLAAVLTSRLDALDDEAKLVAYTAAVIGREFDRATLAAIIDGEPDLDTALGSLQRRGLIRETARIPEPTYQFKHALTQQAAYEAGLLSTRRALHLRLAERIEATDPERVHELAHHFLEAGETARALPYLITAGERAFRSGSASEASRYFEQAVRAFCDDHPLTVGRHAYEGLGVARMSQDDMEGALQSYRELLAVATSRDHPSTQASAYNKLGVTEAMRGQLEEAKELLERARELATAVEDKDALAEYHVNSCLVHTVSGDLDEAGRHERAAVELWGGIPDPADDATDIAVAFHRAFGLARYANTLIRQTRYEEARAAIDEARTYAEGTNQLSLLAVVTGEAQPLLQMRDGEIAAALDTAKEGAALAGRIGAEGEESAAAATASQAARLLGRWDDAVACAERALAAGRSYGMPLLQVVPAATLAFLHSRLGEDLEQVRRRHADALELLDAPLGEAVASAALAELGMCALDMGFLDLASAHFERGLASESFTIHMARPVLLAGTALVHLRRGELDPARQRADEATAYASERAMQHVLPFTALVDAEVAAASGDLDAALDHAERGDALARAQSMRPARVDLLASSMRVLAATGRDAEAAARRATAEGLIDEMAAEVAEPARRERFRTAALRRL